jgi:hypothetical protein
MSSNYKAPHYAVPSTSCFLSLRFKYYYPEDLHSKPLLIQKCNNLCLYLTIYLSTLIRAVSVSINLYGFLYVNRQPMLRGCHHDMVRRHVADGGDGLQIYRVAENILNK